MLLLTALLMVPLLAFTALAVDLGAWYAQGARIQRAADAGALAGVVWATDPTKWDTVARDTITRNGYTDGVNGADGDRSADSATRRMRANVQVTGDAVLLEHLHPGWYQRINREAVAEYVVPVPMGSPKSSLGNDPTLNTTQPQFWLNIAGPGGGQGHGRPEHAHDSARRPGAAPGPRTRSTGPTATSTS